MNGRTLAMITTRLAPQICGVGAFSWQLQRHWPGQADDIRFFVVDGARQSINTLGYSAIEQFDGRPSKLAAALNRLGPVDLLLHYAGRAYSRIGCPFWLPRVLQRWKETFPAGRLLVFFHELPAKLPVTSRHYWIGLGNRSIIRQLARLADVITTNTEDHISQLRNISNRTDIHFVSVGSNIEPLKGSAESRAATEFAIFGLPFARWQTLQLFEQQIRSWHESGALTRLHLIGPHDAKFDEASRELIRAWRDPSFMIDHGLLPANDVSELLARIRFGFSNATLTNWSKSGVFMAYAAHGCAVIANRKGTAPPMSFTVAPDEVMTLTSPEIDARAHSLRNWYEHNADWNVIAQKIADLFLVKTKEEAVR